MRKTFLASYLPGFRRDIQEAVAWSEVKFGASAADRYGLLIRQALRDVLEEPTRPGAKARPELAPHAYVYHLIFSRERVAGERVKAPRHFLLYRHMNEKVEFARLLHDSRDLVRHIPLELQDE
jgi:plasmid stabilization system protein ParE